jgi:hypothetical protein
MPSIFERKSSRNNIHILDNLSPPGSKTWIWTFSAVGGAIVKFADFISRKPFPDV